MFYNVMEIAKRDQLMQRYKDEIVHQKKVLHDRYTRLKKIHNPILKVVREAYKQVFERMDSEFNEHTRQLDHILTYINRLIEEDDGNLELLKEKKNLLGKQRGFERLKLSLNKMLR